MPRYSFLIASAALALGASAAHASDFGVKVGVLTCQVEPGWGLVVGSSKSVDCIYRPVHGAPDTYHGSISKLGLDLGYTDSGAIVWDVVAPTSDVGPGALAGIYGGATASATILSGFGANVLLGGFDRSIALQPVSVTGDTGIDLAAGLAGLHLEEVPPPPPPPPPVAMISPSPPAPVAVVPPRTQRFTIFFASGGDQLNPQSREVIREAAETIHDAQDHQNVQVMVFGNTDTVGTYRYNDGLSDRRAATVKDELARDGLDPARIEAVGHAFDDQRVDTGPGMPEQMNRNATIVIRTG